jgi:ribosomal protein S18 acetylase RimI-like enzyme
MPVTVSTPADAAELTKLVNMAYRGETSKKGWTTEAYMLSGNRIDEATVAEYLANPQVTIPKYTNGTGNIIGCVYLENKTDHLYLGMLSVNPELQAGGIGRILLQQAEVLALQDGLHTIRMTVISSRTELIAWYQRRGYEATGELLPFHVDQKFGVPNTPIELMVLEKKLD